jgi:hypothetical protein
MQRWTRILALALAAVHAPVLAQVSPQPEPTGQPPVDAADMDNATGVTLRAARVDRANQDQMVVTGSSTDASPAEVFGQARAITATGNSFDEPLARFEQPVCPGVLGLTRETAGLVIDRLRTNAGFVGLRVQEDGCTANFVVAVVDNGQAMLDRMIRDNPARFEYLNPLDRRELLAPGPARAWTDVQPATRDGMPIARVRDLTSPPTSGQWAAHSNIYTFNRNEITMVWVVLDREAVRGLTLQQVADYATMRGLAQTRPAPEMAISSILGLFSPSGPWPEELTDFDRAYLTAMYDWVPNIPAAVRIGRVAGKLRAIQADNRTSENERQ